MWVNDISIMSNLMQKILAKGGNGPVMPGMPGGNALVGASSTSGVAGSATKIGGRRRRRHNGSKSSKRKSSRRRTSGGRKGSRRRRSSRH